MMWQTCSRISSASQNVAIVYNSMRQFILTISLISNNKMYVFILICVRAAEIGLVILQEATPHWASLYWGWKGAQSSDNHKRLGLVTVYSCDREGVTFPSVLQGSSAVRVFYTELCRCQYSHSPPQIQVTQPRSHTISGLFWASEANKEP